MTDTTGDSSQVSDPKTGDQPKPHDTTGATTGDKPPETPADSGLANKLDELDLNDIAVEIKNLKFTYEASKAGYLLNDISLTFPRSAMYVTIH